MDNKIEPRLIDGGIAIDDRGTLIFNNSFNFKGIKRFYMVENFSTDTIRAFHGHLKEEKYALVISGSAIIATVEMDDPVKPNKDNTVHRFILSDKKPALLHIPAGFANGFRFLTPQGKILFFSTTTTEESKNDDYRFPADYWGMKIWQVINR
ncbi:MAG: dTDP-4-dehydrorhamnose 3,5-epimerase family protein [Candidatus Vogelbacteria bacterium]|nr:dTDP-4-dehydrorhamnose 3,5-epimerase family protein [Candidatus Vogelbacteria bacterium]